MKMFVWDDVLCDYTSGMICINAESVVHAREIARAAYEDKEAWGSGGGLSMAHKDENFQAEEPNYIIEGYGGAAVYGGV